jgi:hypothetical protein
MIDGGVGDFLRLDQRGTEMPDDSSASGSTP